VTIAGGGASVPLGDLAVLCVDCQTTGATPALGALLELGWLVARPGEPSGRARAYWTEVPPPHRVSRIVRQLTGFDESCRAEAVPAPLAWARLLDDAAGLAMPSGIPTVIHFARFELAFLRDLHERARPGEPFPLDAACLHEIARRLLPDLPRRNLRALAGFLGFSPELVRRSAGHVEATAFAWRALVERLAPLGVRTWGDLGAFLDERAPPRSQKRGYPIEATRRRSLPDEPGVYRFVRSNGDVLYVGKATSLRKRVSSHFVAGRKATERALEMLSQAQDVEVTVTASTLEAALLEADEIKRLDPPYNVHLRETGRQAWFATREGLSVADLSSEVARLGPFPSRSAIRGLGALVALAGGAPPDRRLAGSALGAPEAFAPTEDVFAEGWRIFRDASLVAGRSAWGRVIRGAARLRGTEEEESEDSPEGWDAPRVARHLERTLRGAGQLLRRARIMTILSESDVVFREVGSPPRLLRLRGGSILHAGAVAGAPPCDDPARVPWRARQRTFDAAGYDRLRVLVTELVRVLAEGGEVEVRTSGQTLVGRRAARLLHFV